MTPKEKAKQLVDKFSIVGLQQRNEGITCALIAVDEILKEYAVLQIETSFCYKQYLYWEEVKQEIESL